MSPTAEQKKRVQDSFEQIQPITDTVAQLFYDKLFEYDPSLRELFKGDMVKQGAMFMTAIHAAVKGLDDTDTFVPFLEGIAVKHLDYGVAVDDYTPVGNALLFALSEALAEKFSSEDRKAWIAVYDSISEIMRRAAYKSYNKETYVNTTYYNY